MRCSDQPRRSIASVSMRSHPSTKANRDTPLVFLLMFFAFTSSAWAQAEEELIRGAKKEGKVVFWSSMQVKEQRDWRDFVDTSVMDELQREGFLNSVYK